ncbi:MAG TPA: hypothetical protein VMM36_09450, partial [Opitutaceae bacterium]|nr:hypothetical protein [Opitutaceae bacterium]
LIEIHSQPKWIAGVEPPSTDELLEVLVPSSAGVAGISTLPPARHAVVLAVHSWAHEPLRRIRDLLDVAVLAESADRDEALAISRSWGAERVWRTTIRASEAVLLDGAAPWMLRVWARSLRMARERTVLESHLERLLSNFSALPPAEALRALPDVLAAEILPKHDETWPTKLRRTRKALRNAFLARSEHDSASTAGSCGGQPEERGT